MFITESSNNLTEIFKLRKVEDYSGFIEGDYEASLGKTIKTLIYATETFIVYIDTDNYIEWTYNSHYDGASSFFEKFGLIVNRISFLEELSFGKLDAAELLAFRRLLGESLARLLKEQDEKNALSILKSAEELINTTSRQKFIKTALIATSIIAFIEALLWLAFNNNLTISIHYQNIFNLIFYSLSGGIGGFIFLMLRSKNIEIEPSLRASIYQWEGFLRILYGVLSAFLTYLAINSKIIFGNIDNPKFSILTLLICIISGASEKMIPGIVNRIEAKI